MAKKFSTIERKEHQMGDMLGSAANSSQDFSAILQN